MLRGGTGDDTLYGNRGSDDLHGTSRLDWTVPTAPTAQTDAAPRAYAMTATGAAAGGGTRTAYMIEPLVAYPDTAPCAADDTATTTLGRSVQIPVLGNDTAPTDTCTRGDTTAGCENQSDTP